MSGFEPEASYMRSKRSTTELHPHMSGRSMIADLTTSPCGLWKRYHIVYVICHSRVRIVRLQQGISVCFSRLTVCRVEYMGPV